MNVNLKFKKGNPAQGLHNLQDTETRLQEKTVALVVILEFT